MAHDDDSPELTREQAAELRPARQVEDPAVLANFKRAGRPKAESPKVRIGLRLDQDVVEAFKATGPGWQTRINDALRGVAPVKAG